MFDTMQSYQHTCASSDGDNIGVLLSKAEFRMFTSYSLTHSLKFKHSDLFRQIYVVIKLI